MKITKHLAQFLAEEGALTKFIDNLHKGGNNNIITNQITTAFSWHSTPEGMNYWEDLHYKYKLLKTLRYNENN
jgi:hypothetical protein